VFISLFVHCSLAVVITLVFISGKQTFNPEFFTVLKVVVKTVQTYREL